METETIDYYSPIRNQVSKIVTALIPIFVFSIIKLIWGKNHGGFGLIEYWFQHIETIPNDYKLLFWGSLGCSIILFFHLFNTKLFTKSEKTLFEHFRSAFFGIIPVICNLFILLFLFYLIVYRGIWSLGELKNGFAILPLLKFLIFTGLGVYGYIPFCRLYMLKRFIKLGKKEEASAYVTKYKLFRL